MSVRKQDLANRNRIDPGYRLCHWEEAIGPLESFGKEDDSIKAKIGRITLILPLEMENRLRPLIGIRIGILRTDIPSKEWLLRVIPDVGQETECIGSIANNFDPLGNRGE